MSLILYSTNVYLKFAINERYGGGAHYVWCSECFDGTSLATAAPFGVRAGSSNPRDIYNDLKRATERQDRGHLKIAQQKSALTAQAVFWKDAGKITEDEMVELQQMIQLADFMDWRPVIYVIPRHLVSARLEIVPPVKRATATGVEYIVSDLHRSEFDLIEI
jgi:hypothetical protein